MEKYSAYRDPGTGIQPFLTPVPPTNPGALSRILLPFAYALASVRTFVVLLSLALYIVLVQGVCLLLMPIPPLYRFLTNTLTAILCRLALLAVGLVWIPAEIVTRKRGRTARAIESWNPDIGDLVVSNWVSWVEIVWLAFKCNPIFVMPVPSDLPAAQDASEDSSPVTYTPGRRTGTGSANISVNRPATSRIPIRGFRTMTLLQAIRATGEVPSPEDSSSVQTLEEIRTSADRPIVVFPEGATSNGRGLLRFADVFTNVSVPPTRYSVFVMCVRYDPPTHQMPTLSHSIPSSYLNPLPHLFQLCTSFFPATMSIRLLSPSESPSSPLFLVSELVTGTPGEDQLSECTAALISQIGKMKRTGMGWENKTAFLRFYRGKNANSSR